MTYMYICTLKRYTVKYSLSERKTICCAIRSDGRLYSVSSPRGRKAEPLIANAIATKAESSTALAASKPGHELLLYEALLEGLEEEMERDPTVCVVGEDVGHYGGSYKVTKTLADKYGDLHIYECKESKSGMWVKLDQNILKRREFHLSPFMQVAVYKICVNELLRIIFMSMSQVGLIH
ncbi:pyruvate dehydrogenase E1 component subunit beta-3, chloroplastic-like [Rhododendron vialii]|uniref:pyruvate dehydrogenase E1 component subunit beta-3, chloroplastic-like n=1 Tax=Rhododendron vialii TaxID=182163 RepID=UPI00265E06E3|nr:pyruvate dehydrogenase E1 component subunit beta-3, chloroplastic-like [Rhododendron vialii]